MLFSSPEKFFDLNRRQSRDVDVEVSNERVARISSIQFFSDVLKLLLWATYNRNQSSFVETFLDYRLAKSITATYYHNVLQVESNRVKSFLDLDDNAANARYEHKQNKQQKKDKVNLSLEAQA